MTDTNRATTEGARYPTLKYTPPVLPKFDPTNQTLMTQAGDQKFSERYS